MSHMSKLFNFEIFTPTSDNLKIQHFDTNPNQIGYIWLQGYEQFINTQNKAKQRDLNSFFANISKTISQA